MTCPHCHAETYVCRGSPTGSTRTRRCTGCQREFGTVEVYAIEHPRHVMRMHTREILGRNGADDV